MPPKKFEVNAKCSRHVSNWNRRDFLSVACVAPLLAMGPSWPAAANDMRSVGVATEREELIRLVGADGIEILSSAALAPSGHNTQPWTVRVIDAMHWTIGIDRQRALPAVDPVNREAMLSIGAFLENLIIAAHYNGYEVEYNVIASSGADSDLIDVRLRKATAVEFPMASLGLRRTVRSDYANTLISPEDLKTITGGSPDFVYVARDTAGARYLAEATIEANRKQAYRDDAQEELANWIRWDKKDQERFRNGLTPASMEITGFAGWYVSTFYDRASVLKKSFRDTTVKQVVDRVAQGGGWLVQTGDSSVAGLVETGRKFERMWLKLRDRGIAIHPMTQVLEETSEPQNVAKTLGVSGTPQFVLRIGYVKDYPKPVSPRMPLARFTRPV